jgi:predicted methyltransferase MtxX (methanogen marker protein 4)
VIRSDEQTSRRAKVKSGANAGVVVCAEVEPVKARTLVIGRLTMGRCEVGVRGLGRAACISAELTRAGSRQRRCSTVEVGESRWREGRQEVGRPRRCTI